MEDCVSEANPKEIEKSTGGCRNSVIRDSSTRKKDVRKYSIVREGSRREGIKGPRRGRPTSASKAFRTSEALEKGERLKVK